MTRLTGLDTLRGAAALVVLAFHSNEIFGSSPVFPKGWLAVDFFFALSGFVMARTYEARLKTGLQPRAFILRRFWRFWPVMLVGGILGLPILFMHLGAWALPVAILNLLFIPMLVGRHLFPLNGPFWSLFYELFANIAHAFVFQHLSRRILVLTIVICAIGMSLLGAHYGSTSLGTAPATFFAGFVRVTLAYLIGTALYRLWGDDPPAHVRFPLALLIVPLLMIGREPVAGWAYELAFVLLFVPLVLLGGLQTTARSTILGDISFPLYAFHLPILVYAQAIGAGQVIGSLAAIFTAWAYTRAAAWLSNKRRQRAGLAIPQDPIRNA